MSCGRRRAACPRCSRARQVTAVSCGPGHEGMDDGARSVVVEEPVPQDGEALLRQSLGIGPVAAPDRHDATFGERGCGRRQRTHVQPGLHRPRQDRIGTLGLTVEQPRDPFERQRRRPPLAPGRQTVPCQLGVPSHLTHTVATQKSAQLGLPGVERAAVRERSRDRRPFTHGRPALGRGRLAHDRSEHGAEDRDRWIPFDQPAVVEPLEPTIDRLEAAPGIRGQRTGGDQAGDPVGVAPRLGVGDGHLREAVRLVPRGGAGMELGHHVGLALVQLGTKQLLEQPVVAVPLPPAIEGHDREVGALQGLQEPARARSVHDGVAEGTAHALEHRRSRHERHAATRHARQQLRP